MANRKNKNRTIHYALTVFGFYFFLVVSFCRQTNDIIISNNKFNHKQTRAELLPKIIALRTNRYFIIQPRKMSVLWREERERAGGREKPYRS